MPNTVVKVDGVPTTAPNVTLPDPEIRAGDHLVAGGGVELKRTVDDELQGRIVQRTGPRCRPVKLNCNVPVESTAVGPV